MYNRPFLKFGPGGKNNAGEKGGHQENQSKDSPPQYGSAEIRGEEG
jgi:hypothetical protein